MLPKIHRRLYDVPWRPVISNSGTPIEKALEFLDNKLKEVMLRFYKANKTFEEHP